MDVYGLIGNPVGHSVSPPMHEAAYEATGIDARYVTLEPDPETLGTAIDGARALGVRGLNVTIPFKERVLASVEPDDVAAEVGAVNTIDFGSRGDGAGTPTGHNTDAEGAVRALREGGATLDGARAVVVGAGGAGRAVTVGLANAGATVGVANRTVERARDLADDAGDAVSAHPLSALPDLLADATVLVNATSVGMSEDRSPVDADALHDRLTVLDAVYDPLETRLLRDAAAAGARTVDGSRMLLYQGAAAFEQWTGLDAPTAAMESALEAALEGG